MHAWHGPDARGGRAQSALSAAGGRGREAHGVAPNGQRQRFINGAPVVLSTRTTLHDAKGRLMLVHGGGLLASDKHTWEWHGVIRPEPEATRAPEMAGLLLGLVNVLRTVDRWTELWGITLIDIEAPLPLCSTQVCEHFHCQLACNGLT